MAFVWHPKKRKSWIDPNIIDIDRKIQY